MDESVGIESVGQKIFHFLLDKITFIWYYKYNKGVDTNDRKE